MSKNNRIAHKQLVQERKQLIMAKARQGGPAKGWWGKGGLPQDGKYTPRAVSWLARIFGV